MAKTLSDYLLMVQKEYTYKIKIAHAMDDKDFERMERPLVKYDVYDVKSMTKTPIQKNPLDFPNVSASEVYIIEIVSLLPISTETLRWELSKSMHFHMDYIHVRNENSPYNEYEEKMLKFQEETYMPKMDDPFYKTDMTGDNTLYGDKYNEKMVKELTDKTGIDMPMEKVSVDNKFKEAIKTFKAEGIFTKVKN
jgi:hypothetical protein